MPLLPTIITIRPIEESLPSLQSPANVEVYHPQVRHGYPILLLRAFPSAPSSTVVGIPVGLVLDACSILAGNQHGELQCYDAPHARVAGAESGPGKLLTAGVYNFVVVQPGGYAISVF
jgi:hypothetical protein